ncbi:unnamed protein product [Phytophthora fragariaefolia]|uniref:Unnamed protein product n=1 Tax=Phytophthora fragariaefolia TaxID=1490495 RepID=A0A9W6Y6G5_9STRA|nr:unnamed protein product [Phytophthora fragariaefolia]
MTSRRATLDDGAGGILELDDSDSGAEDASLPRQRPQWTRIWRTTNSDGLAEFRASLPTHAVGKSNQIGCTINQLLDDDYNLHIAVLTQCGLRWFIVPPSAARTSCNVLMMAFLG